MEQDQAVQPYDSRRAFALRVILALSGSGAATTFILQGVMMLFPNTPTTGVLFIDFGILLLIGIGWLLLPQHQRKLAIAAAAGSVGAVVTLLWYGSAHVSRIPQLSIEMSLIGEPYVVGSDVWGIKWENNFRPYRLTINGDNQQSLEDLMLHFQLPVAIVFYSNPPIASGAEGLTISQKVDEESPPTIGPPVGQPGRHQPIKMYFNDLESRIGTLRPKGTVIEKVVGTTEAHTDFGYVELEYFYTREGKREGPVREVRSITLQNEKSVAFEVNHEPMQDPCRRHYQIVVPADRVTWWDPDRGMLELQASALCTAAGCSKATSCRQLGDTSGGEEVWVPMPNKGERLRLRLSPAFGPECGTMSPLSEQLVCK